METKSLNSIFDGKKLLRIPDYQRGYAWGEHQYKEFWEDLKHIKQGKIHYTGVLTLEKIEKSETSKWEDDKWFLGEDDSEHNVYYVVDGQQRLTTSILLIQAILDTFKKFDSKVIEDKKIEDIEQQYILVKHPKPEKASRSFIFGYDIDNPSDEYLKTQIFGINSNSYTGVENLYTKNLKNAKEFFLNQLSSLSQEEIEHIFKNLTVRMKFSLYEIEKNVDINVAFETMNNRGKPLTVLEKLKNRLIYLTTFFSDNQNQEILRKNINNVWKTMYEYLGKNPNHALSEDNFLKNHWIMYFTYSRKKGDDYIRFLLDEEFNPKRFLYQSQDNPPLTEKEIQAYIDSLQNSVRYWYSIHFPYMENKLVKFTEREKFLLDKLGRLGFKAFRPLILACFLTNQNHEKIEIMLKEMERYNFTIFGLSQKRSNTGDTHFYTFAREILRNENTIDNAITSIKTWQSNHFNSDAFVQYIDEKFKYSDKLGFYKWDDLRYFLFEYEQSLRDASKTNDNKLTWDNFNRKDYKSVEHILPQTPDDIYWQEKFGNFSDTEKLFLTHSLGNLVALSNAKNASLQNMNFSLKKRRGEENIIGYHNGSFSEKEVAENEDWTAQEILKRGHKMLNFMEEHWDIQLGEENKKKLLHLEFLENQ